MKRKMITTRMFLIRLKKKGLYSEVDLTIEKGTRGRLGNILHIPLGYSCNNNCIHCPYKNKRKLYRNSEEYKKLLKKNRRDRNLLIISGGEPTIREDIFELIAYSRKLSYEWIQLKSNGRLFSHKDFTQKIVDTINKNQVYMGFRDMGHPGGYNFGNLGIFEFNIRLYGHNAKLHDSITSSRGSFDQTIRGIKNLIRLNQIVIISIVISKKNYKFLPEIAKLAYFLGAAQIEFQFVGLDKLTNNKNIIPKINSIKKFIPQTVDCLKSYKDHPQFMFNLPFCLIKGYEKYQSGRWYPYDQHEMYKLIDFDRSYSYYDLQIKNKTKGEKCYSCVYDPICSGLLKSYIKKYGSDELVPIFGRNVDETELKLLKNLKNLNLEDLNFELKKQKIDFAKLKADAVVLFSGGADSTLSAELFAEQNKNKKIILLTYDNIPPPVGERSTNIAKYLLKKHKNIIEHLIVPIPYALSKKIIFEKLEENYHKYNRYITCAGCSMLRVVYTIYLLKKYLKGSIVVNGSRSEVGYSYLKKQSEDKLLNRYSIRLIRPVENFSKRDVIRILEKRGGPIHLMGPKYQAVCWSNLIKSRLKKHKKHKDFNREGLLRDLTLLLKVNGVYEESLEQSNYRIFIK